MRGFTVVVLAVLAIGVPVVALVGYFRGAMPGAGVAGCFVFAALAYIACVACTDVWYNK